MRNILSGAPYLMALGLSAFALLATPSAAAGHCFMDCEECRCSAELNFCECDNCTLKCEAE